MAGENGLTLNTRLEKNDYVSGSTKQYVTPEMRAYFGKFTDPLTLNFKLMIDFDKPYGLFADENIVNSALAYLKRIGENERYEMLKHWIGIFKDFVKHYDFLILSCEGVDNIISSKPEHMFGQEDDKLTFNIRETSDMRVQSIISMWRHIWYDDIRCVEVIPANLRRFDLNILIYSAGYYNMAVYDLVDESGNTNADGKVFPTIKKLSQDYFVDNGKYDFNHHMVYVGEASINHEESGKNFFANLSNESSDEIVMNNICFNFRFAGYRGIFNNIFGDFDFVKALSLAAAQNRLANELTFNDVNLNTKAELQKAADVNSQFGDLFATAPESKYLNFKLTNANLRTKPKQYLNSIIQSNAVIGNALNVITEKGFVGRMIRNTGDFGLKYLEDRFVYSNIAKLNNKIFSNFADNFVDAYQNWLAPKKDINKIEVNSEMRIAESTGLTEQNIKYSKQISSYERKSF